VPPIAQQPAEAVENPAEPVAERPAEPMTERPAELVEVDRGKSALVGVRAEVAERPTEVWAKLVADPGHAPELLALAAVRTIGPRAYDWARGVRQQYPAATDDAVARLAARQFTRFGNVGSVLGAVAGSYAPIALLGTAALTDAELILHVAAAYGLDPTDEARALDLLVLTRVHPDAESAAEALAAARQPTYEDGTGAADAAWRLGRMLTAQAGGWTALRLVNRLFPGTSLLAATLTSRAAADAVAHRATAYYRRRPATATAN
jgi:hypothetical protein